MVNTRKEFPRGILDQVISWRTHDGGVQRASDPGLKLLEPSWKQTVHSIRTQTLKLQAASFKPQAASIKLQAASYKLPDSRSFIKFQAASIKGLDYNKTVDRMPYMEGNLVW